MNERQVNMKKKIQITSLLFAALSFFVFLAFPDVFKKTGVVIAFFILLLTLLYLSFFRQYNKNG
jgi:uncharacterized membrane protein